MNKAQANQNVSKLNDEIQHWKLTSALGEGQVEVLRMVACNNPLESILNTLCNKAQLYNTELLCSVLRLNNKEGTLHPIASVSLPKFYCDALDGVNIGLGVGSCGTAAFLKERVIVEDINTHPYWSQYKELALKAGVQACWSEPILGADNIVFGTFAIYYRQPTAPTEEDLKFIELYANLAAVVFENNLNKSKLLEANNLLSLTIDERNEQLIEVNAKLKDTLKKQKDLHSLDISAEKIMTTNYLISGFLHEMNTPVGNALTATTTIEDKLEVLHTKFVSEKLTRQLFISEMKYLMDTVALSKRSLLQVTELLTRFKDANVSSITETVSEFYLLDFLKELHFYLTKTLGKHTLEFNCENFKICSAKVTLWQVLVNLIENSITHGFSKTDHGLISINIIEKESEIIFNYQDNGCGITDKNGTKVFEPFYSSNRKNKSIGLGLNIVKSLISHVLNGQIRLVNSPVGVRYEIKLPKE